MKRENEKELRSPTSEIPSVNQDVMDLTVFSKDGRFYVESKEGEWADVTGKWKGKKQGN